MKANEFNDKYENYLEDGHYGMAIYNEEVVDYMDKEFEKEIQTNPSFTYTQIKLKFGSSRVYTNSTKDSIWEAEIDKILKNYD